MHWSGLAGMSRRVPEYSDYFMSSTWMGTSGTLLLLTAVVILLRAMCLSWSSLSYGSWH